MTIREALLDASHRLELQRVPHPRRCAEVLFSHFLNVDKTYLYSHDDEPLPPAICEKIENAIGERISGVPVQYIVGHQEFYGRDFLVNPSVLIPRPETEHIIEAVLETGHSPNTRIIDVGTGSGCIGTTLALELPHSSVFAADISEAALQTAKQNAQRLGACVAFVCMDVLDAVSDHFDFVVSNPPYVPRRDAGSLQREVRDHEPHVALFDPGDDLAIYRRLIQSAINLLKPGGRLIMEIGFAMEESVLSLIDGSWNALPTRRDLQGIPRAVVAQKPL